jgi:hypothetical protein
MGYLIDEKTFINDNIFKFQERLDSQYSRFLDKSPTFVNYYHINNINSIGDNGFENVEAIIGPNSPIKFNKINNFPMYGLDSILLDLNDEEEGLDVNFESELIILPNTVIPYPNDIFTITYLSKSYIFMVTTVSYDTIKSNNYYKIGFMLKSISIDTYNSIELQVEEKYDCIFRNIGTQEKCLIREEDMSLLIKLNEVYRDIADKYKILFFNNKYNNFIFKDAEIKLYDKYLSQFIMNNKLFNERYNYNTIYLTNEENSNTFLIDYEKSFFRNIEKCKKPLFDTLFYNYHLIIDRGSVFVHYNDTYVKSIDFTTSGTNYLNPDLISRIKSGDKVGVENILYITIIDYFNNNITSIYNIDLEKLYSFDYLNYNFEIFILLPIVLFILRLYYTKFMSTK